MYSLVYQVEVKMFLIIMFYFKDLYKRWFTVIVVAHCEQIVHFSLFPEKVLLWIVSWREWSMEVFLTSKKKKKKEVFFIWFGVHTREIHRRCMSEDWAAAYFLSFVISFGDLIRYLNIVKGGNSIMGPTRMHPGTAKTTYFPLICFFF